ncbi:MAG: TonB-dependent receptor, partial [Prevotella sp.]|nr:TonB-dependent receptor [Prevotella sp.]
YLSRITYTTGRLSVTAELKGHARQSKYGAKYGETSTAAWTIVNISAARQFSAGNSQFSVRAGVENLTDRHYATYADWCHIPQKGRNIYLNLTFEL